jgi:hypothetical protein
MKSFFGLVLACGACCAVPFIATGLIGIGVTGAALSFWWLELGAAIAALAGVVWLAIRYRRNRTGAVCQIAGGGPTIDRPD